MTKKLRTATFKFFDILMILTMVLASPMNVSASPTTQESTPVITVDSSDYVPGASAHVTGSGFAADSTYDLVANGPSGQASWGSVTADGSGGFAADSPALDTAGSYEVSAFAAGNDTPVASASFTVTAPPAPTDPPTEPPTEEPTDEPTATATDTPTEEPTATATDAPTEEPTATATDEPTSEPTATPTDTPTSEPTATPTNTPIPSDPPTITSDQADYPQGGLVTLTGTNWQGDTEVRIVVNDDIGQTWRRDVTVSVAGDGTVTDSFYLPNYFVATFSVVARGLQTDRVVTTSFTDAPKITAKTHQGQENPGGTYTSGNVTTYQEGDYINFRFTLEANEASSGQLQVRFTGDDGTCLFFDGSFALGTHDGSAPAIQPISGATPTVTTAGAPVATAFGTSNGEWVQTITISFSAAGEAVVNYYLRLSDEAGECNGSSQHSRLNPGGGDVGQTGQQNVPVPADKIIELPEITVLKNIDRDGDGTFEDTADAGEYCFTLDGSSCISTDSSGQVIFTNVTPDGPHTITETQLDFSQGTYDFISGSGTNCTFSGSTATATVASGTTSTDATCIFSNGLTNGTLTIVKVVVNDNGGTKQVSDFPLFYNGTPATSGVANTVTPGNYTVTETQQAGYTATFSGDCNSSGVVTVGAGQNKTCTITNNDQPGTLIVIKHVINDNGGTATAANFTLDSGGANDSPDDFAGTEAPGTSVTLDTGSYNVTETGPSGYTASFSADCSGSIANGETKTCTVTNDDNAATLIIIKHVINDNGGTANAGDFTMNVTATNPTNDSFPGEESPGTTITLDAGTYSVSETGPSGYTASYSADCSGTIAAGQTKTCTVTNDDQLGTLIVKKVVVNDNGGTFEANDFSFSVNGGTAVPFEADGQNDLTVNAGIYTVTEPAVVGYSTTYDNCSNLVIPNGGSATCTITNDDQAATLIVKKVVINDNGGTKTAVDFSFKVNGETAITFEADGQNDLIVNAGTYTVTEPAVSGYTTTYNNCSNLVIPNGGTATCTITNDDQAAHLKLVKVVVNDNGGTATAASFTLSASGPTPISGAGGAESDVNAGTYTLSETNVPGYTASAWSCVGGTQNGSDITLANGQSATCTITNDDDAPSLTLVKVVVNDNGGTATANQWTLTASGPTSFSGAGPSVSSDVNFEAGTYTLSESGPAGYTASAWSCVGGTQNGSDITLANGESATCTITNNDNAPSLTLVKVVINDNGGTALTTDFTLSANGPTPISGAGGATGDATFDAGTYDLSETGPAGYTASDWVCMGGTQNDVDTITLGLGESATCTITNDDQAPSLTLIKMVISNDGGNALASDWILTASGPTGFSGPGPSVSNGTSFDAGTYGLSESGPTGYLSGDWVCAGGTQDDADTITLELGESATCTITNNDVAPTLKLVKVVSNNDGGNAVANDWTLFAEAAAPNVGRNFSNLGGSGVFQTVFANTGYDLSESTVAGYTAGDWDCDGGTLVDSTITLAEGETGVTCTITNDDSAPTLTLIKIVVNDDGGDAVVSDFPLFINGNSVISGISNTLSANTLYTASETNLAGYTASAWGGDCAPDGTITLNEGQNAVCTITNDDVAPTLKLVKNVLNNNGGNAVADDWTLSASAAAPFDGRNFSHLGGSGAFQTVFANQGYDLSETTLSGYTAGSWSCDGGTLVGSTVTLTEGEAEVTCSITNDDVAPQLRLVKTVVNDDGGNAVVADFPLFIDGNSITSGVFVSVTANTVHTASETAQTGYTASAWGGDCAADGTITLNEGEVKTCTITNDDVAPTLKLVKVVVNNNGGNAVANDWTLSAAAAAPLDGRNFSNAGGSGIFQTVFANAGYDLSETTLPGYIAGSWSCTGGALVGSTVTLNEGDTSVTCTITNDDIAPTLTLIKNVVNDNGGNAAPDDFKLIIGGNAATSGTAYTLDANTPYAIDETQLSGYTFVDITGDSKCPAILGGNVTLDEGENVTCTITNDDIAPTLTLIKNVINDSGGNAQPDDFKLTIGGNAATSGTAYTLDANTPYAIDETQVTGYSFVDITGDPECPAALAGTVTLDEGENVTCTITNDDQPATLIIIKHVINDNGGTALAADFTLDSGGTDDTPDNFPGEEAPGTTVTLDAGAYNVTETGPSGYSASFSADCSGSIATGQTKTCTVINDDIQPQLIVIKHVINDNGGTADAGDFTMEVSGNNVNPVNFAGSELGVNVALDAGSYNVGEIGPTGYAPDFSADCTGSIAVGETKTCTITNNDIAPTLTVIKILLPNSDTGKFNLQIDGVTKAANVGNNGTTNAVAVDVGTHTVSEIAGTGTSLANYVTTIGGDCAADGTVTLALAENKTCTITNARRGTIIVEKQTNPNGAPGSFTFTGDTAGTISDNGQIVVANLAPGTYTSTEADPAASLFVLTSIVCNDGSSAHPSTGNLATRTATFNLDPGETVKCTFTNTKDFHAGTIGFWKNWRNHYSSTQFQLLINYLKANNALVYNKPGYPLTTQKVDAIFNLGSKTPREQMILAQFTALKFNLAITQLDGTGGLVQKNDDLCTAGVVDISGISGAASFFGTSTPTIQQIVAKVEGRWTGKLTTNRTDWKWNLTTSQKSMLINVITGINEGTLVMSSGCP